MKVVLIGDGGKVLDSMSVSDGLRAEMKGGVFGDFATHWGVLREPQPGEDTSEFAHEQPILPGSIMEIVAHPPNYPPQ